MKTLGSGDGHLLPHLRPHLVHAFPNAGQGQQLLHVLFGRGVRSLLLARGRGTREKKSQSQSGEQRRFHEVIMGGRCAAVQKIVCGSQFVDTANPCPYA